MAAGLTSTLQEGRAQSPAFGRSAFSKCRHSGAGAPLHLAHPGPAKDDDNRQVSWLAGQGRNEDAFPGF